MEKIEPGKSVESGYDLYAGAPDGTETLVHQTDPESPERIVFGVTRGVVVPLEHALEGKAAGDVFDVLARAEEAFGMPDKDNIVELDRDIFVVDGKFDEEMIKVGNVVPMMTADGFRIDGRVLEVGPAKVKLDFNHPLAGKDVRFRGKVVTVRDATPEELQPAHGCGCGCDHDHCGDDCGCDHEHGHGHCGDGSCGCH